MTLAFDRETIERFRALPAEEAWQQAKDAIYRAGPTSSADFLDAFNQLVEEGILEPDHRM